MFKRLLNECSIAVTLKPEGAMLIKSGVAQITGVDMAWVRVTRNGRQEVYLPGSSLKGMIRAHSERIARTLNDFGACNPFGGKQDKLRSCSSALEDMKATQKHDVNTPDAYAKSCLLCRTFGNTFFMGRLATEDAYVDGDLPEVQQRDGVGIDRFTGGASRGAKFELEVITSGHFKTTLHLQNFELWQLGLLGFVLQDLRDGLVRMGSGKSRGLGKIKAETDDFTFHYVGLRADKKIVNNGEGYLFGAGELLGESEAEKYGMASDDRVAFAANQMKTAPTEFRQLRQTIALPFAAMPWEQLADKWISRAKNAEDGLKAYRFGGK